MPITGIIATMTSAEIVAAIDSEIARLQEARSLLSGVIDIPGVTKPGRGRPKGSKNVAPAPTAKKRQMSDAGRAAIAAAKKRRHAANKK